MLTPIPCPSRSWALLYWQHEIRFRAGTWHLLRHFRLFTGGIAFSRIRPTQLALWSFAIAMAHGAGLMLLPIYFGLCSSEELDLVHRATYSLMAENLGMALLVSLVHALAMVAAGGLVALLVHAWFGMKFLTASWFNLDLVWAVSLILIGGVGLVTA